MKQATENAQVLTEVLVIGGGVSGLVAALVSAQAGFQTILVDQRPLEAKKPTDSRAFAIAPASMQLFTALEVAGRLTQKAAEVHRMAIADAPKSAAHKSALRLDFDARDSAAEMGVLAYIIENNDLISELFDAAKVTQNLSLETGKTLQAFKYAPGAIVARFNDGAAIAAQLIIAADGRNSTVRNLCALEGASWSYDQTAIAAAIRHSEPHLNVAHDLFLPNGPLGVLPLRDQRSSIVWCETPPNAAALLALNPESFCAELQTRLDGRLGDLTLDSERAAFPLSLFAADSMIAPHVALIGDAAHSVHPLAGQGLNIGLRDIAALADTLVDARALGLDIGAITTLERYQRWRRFDNLSYAAATDALNRIFAQQAAPLRALRSAGLAAVNAFGPLKKLFAAEASGLSEAAPRLLRGEALTGA